MNKPKQNFHHNTFLILSVDVLVSHRQIFLYSSSSGNVVTVIIISQVLTTAKGINPVYSTVVSVEEAVRAVSQTTTRGWFTTATSF